MADLRGFDARAVEPAGDFDPIPAGTYLAIIAESEMKPNRAGTGHFLQLTFEIIDGPYKGRLLWRRLNLDHPNATAVTIARAELSAICRAVGVLTPRDSVELHNLPLVIKVACKKRQDTGEIVNEVRGYSPRAAAVETQPAKQGMPAANSTPPPPPSSPPWRR